MTTDLLPSEPVAARAAAFVLTPRIAWAAAKVALVVGTVLNIVNGGDQLWGSHALNPWQAMLNYLVPFCVSSYSAARNEGQRGREQ